MPLGQRQRQTLIWAAVAALFVAVIVLLGPVLTPFVAAAVLGYALEPLVRWMVTHRVPRIVAVTITLILVIAAVTLIVFTLIPLVQKEVIQVRNQLPGLVSNLSENLTRWLQSTFNIKLNLNAADLRAWLTEHLTGSSEEIATAVLTYLKSGTNVALQVLELVLLVPVVLFYLLLDWPMLTKRLHDLIPPRWQPTVDSFTEETDSILGQYFRGQLLVMAILAIYYSVGLLVGGLDMWLPIGVLTGLLVVVPYLGFTTGLILALLSAVLQLGVLRGIVTIGIVYGLGQVLESVYLTPRLVGERIGLHPLAVILSLLAFGLIFGFIGVLLALPLAAVLAVALRRLRETYRDSDFYRRPA